MTPAIAAIVLRATPFGESDLVVTLFGQTCGRVAALAKGARKSQRRFGGGLGLGALGEATLRERPGAELAWLEAFEVTEPRGRLGEDLGRTAHAAYVLELCDRLCAPRQPEPEVFAWLVSVLSRLEAGAATAVRLRVFELGLFKRLGIGPVLDRCVSCGRRDLGDEMVRWIPEGGGVHCMDCAVRGTLLIGAGRLALAQLSEMSWDEADDITVSRDVSAACRGAMLELVGHHVPVPLKSVEFIQKMGG